MFYTLRSTVDIRPQVSRLQMCTVIPSLPEGIVVDTACAITGIPMRETPKTLYTVTAMTENGTISTEIHIEIRDSPYSKSHYIFVKGVFGTTDVPTTSEPTFNWMVSPSLPSGLKMNVETGEISGIPMEEREEMKYSITAMTENETISTEIHIEIRDPLCVNPRNGRSMVIGESMEYHCTQDNKIGVETYMCVFGKNDGEWKLVSDGCKKQREWGSVLRYGIMISYVISVVVGVVFAIVMVIRKKRTPQPPAMENKNLLV